MRSGFTLALVIFSVLLNFSCSNEPVEFTIDNIEEEAPVEGDVEDDIPEDVIYATAKLDGQNFTGNQFQVDTLSADKLKLSFFSDLEQQIFLILPNPPVPGSYPVVQNDEAMNLYSGAFVNSVGNISESTFFSMPETGDITISTFNADTGVLTGTFEFDVATFNNNIILITEGEFEVDIID